MYERAISIAGPQQGFEHGTSGRVTGIPIYSL